MSDNPFGIPIEGTPYNTRRNNPQRPKEELPPYFDAVFADERVTAIVWLQSTPYFNDGDVCEFGVDGFGAILSTEDYSALGVNENELVWQYPDELTSSYSLPAGDPLKEPLHQLELTGGAFEHAYLELFGDHARIVATREKFIIHEYDHD